MGDRPYTLLSCSMSIDGYLDSAGDQRLVLSNEADLDRVDAVRATCDAILVGAETVRNDNPRLLVRSQDRRNERVRHGLSASPIKVTVTSRAKLDPEAQFFADDGADKLLYCTGGNADAAMDMFGNLATVVDAGDETDMRRIGADLHSRGVRRLMVEGGACVLTQFLTADLVDELQLVVAPFFVGDSQARRLVDDGRFPWTPSRHASLRDTQQIGDVVLLRYAMSDRFGESS